MVVLKVLREFAGGTSIHGFTFLVSPKSSSRTKIIWAISLVVALSYASWEMRKSAISKYHYIFLSHEIKSNDYHLTNQFVRTLMDAIHQESIRHQTRIMNPKTTKHS